MDMHPLSHSTCRLESTHNWPRLATAGLLGATLLLSACLGPQRYTLDANGEWVQQTPENIRDLHTRDWVSDISVSNLQGMAIEELPVNKALDRDEPSEWMYEETLTMTLYWREMPAQKTPTEELIRDQAKKHLNSQTKLAFSHELISESNSAQRLANTVYRVRAGDTLAAISIAFYGNPQHWQDIVRANEGLDPANLLAGTQIIIPPLE